MFTKLNASGYKHNGIFYNAEFEDILSKIIACYNLMRSDNVSLANNENAIRDVLLKNYLKDNAIRKKIELTNYLFDREVPEDRGSGRTDVKIQTLDTFQDVGAYYTLECKRLDAANPAGRSGLNAQYIENGICRFVSKTYSAYHKTNGMLGFVVESLNIRENAASINHLLKTAFTKSNTVQELKYKKLVAGFEFSYASAHRTEENDVVIIYHLMLDFSKNIKS